MAGPGDDLFMALAQARAQPDRLARALGAGTQASENILGGYLQGKEYKAKQQEASLKPFEIWSKISDSVGPDIANSIFKQRGIPIPDMIGTGAGVQYTPAELSHMGVFGGKELGRMKDAQDYQQNAPANPDEVNAMFPDHPEIAQRLISGYGGKVPKWVIQSEKTALTGVDRLLPLVEQRDRVLNWQKWNTVLKQANAFTQGSGPVGIASKNNMRGMRAMTLLNKKGDLTPQEYNYITTDMDGIMQGGVPLAQQVNDQGFNTALSTIGQTLGRIKSQPQTINTPEIRALLKANMQHVLNVDNAVIDNNLGFLEKGYGDVISKNRQAWEAAKLAIKRGEQLPFSENPSGTVDDIPIDMGGSPQNPNVSTGVPGNKDPMNLFQ